MKTTPAVSPSKQFQLGGKHHPSTVTATPVVSAGSGCQYARPQTQGSRGGGRSSGLGRGKMAAMKVADEPGTSEAYQEAPAGPSELRDTVLLFSTLVRVLFDTGVTHSFISRALVVSMGLKMEELDYPLAVSHPMGGRTRLRYVCPSCIVYLGDCRTTCNFVVLSMTQFDVILGMDWLASRSARLDCENRKIVLQGEEGDLIHFRCDHGDEDWDAHTR